ncbi:uncharacterized protein LOC113771720 [Coffea eugenioides]|uniref:uncharacterized protein LOC113771720 n=1 Tax=Coffea eugenioides TaxID=49369 RepID=UPI000F61577E|nr:uncharacterized protein LOC113771720 [Coffea eugenioides]
MTHQKNQSVADRRKSISDRRFKNEKKSSSSESLGFFSESPKDWNDFASIMEKSDENLLSESAENGIDLLSPDTSLALATVASSDLSPLSSITMSDEHEEATDTTDPSTTGSLTSVEAELVVKLLNRAIKSRGTNLKTKKVLDALVNLVVEEFIQLPEEKDSFNELMAKKANLVVLSFLLWTIAVFAALFFSGSQRSFSGAIPPT